MPRTQSALFNRVDSITFAIYSIRTTLNSYLLCARNSVSFCFLLKFTKFNGEIGISIKLNESYNRLKLIIIVEPIKRSGIGCLQFSFQTYQLIDGHGTCSRQGKFFVFFSLSLFCKSFNLKTY